MLELQAHLHEQGTRTGPLRSGPEETPVRPATATAHPRPTTTSGLHTTRALETVWFNQMAVDPLPHEEAGMNMAQVIKMALWAWQTEPEATNQ